MRAASDILAIIRAALWGCLILGASTRLRAGPPDFNREVRPILAAKCYACHGPDSDTRKAGLRLDSFAGATAKLKSGGVAIAPGDTAGSALLNRVANPDPELHMPPRGEPLTPREIEVMTRWVESGAEYFEPWAFRSIKNTAAPAVGDLKWCFGEIDRFVLATRQAVKLSAPERDVDAAALLRRLSFDLRGLPPDAADVRAFVAQPTETAYATAVERYLSDPAYGERWGRHWLDLARYAETLAHEFDFEIPYAWRYRDYVIDAFNSDLPPARFLAEQVAGDLLSPRAALGLPNAAPIGTAWWFLGPAVHAPVDVRQDEADRIAGAVDVAGRTFFGLSIACARCHDHKFDPIPTRDFYALAGVVRNTRRIEGFLDADMRAPELAEAASRALVAAASATGASPNLRLLAPSNVVVLDAASNGGAAWSRSGHAFDASGSLVALTTSGEFRAAETGTIDSARLATQLVGSARSPDFTIAKRYVHLRVRGSDAAFRLVVDNYWLDSKAALLFEGFRRRLGRAEGADAARDPRDIGWRVETFDLGRYQGERAHFELVDDGPGWIEVDAILATETSTLPAVEQWDADGVANGVDLAAAGVDVVRQRAVESRQALLACKSPIRALVADEGGPLDEPVHLRGSARSPGAPAPRARLSILGELAPGEIPGSGRLALVSALTDPKRPFFWRTTANRVWLKLFGRGIVETPDDFGQLGGAPWSPELLDHLAAKLAQGMTFKQLIREIVLSHAYRAAPDASEVSPTAWSALPVRRLDAEVIRDAMFAVAGTLNRQTGGPGVPARLTEHMQGRGRPGNSGPIDGANRRSVYLEVRRNFLDPFLQAFDQPTPATTCGRRHASNVPAQALAMLNSELVHLLAKRWADAVVSAGNAPSVPDEAVDRANIERLWLTAYSRPPRAEETEAALEFLTSERAVATDQSPLPRDRAAYAALNHALFASKEFVFLR